MVGEHLLILFALHGDFRESDVQHLLPSATVTSSFTTSVSRKAAGHNTAIQRAAVII